MDTQPPTQSDRPSLASDGDLAKALFAALPPPFSGSVPGYPESSPQEALDRRNAAAIELLQCLAPADEDEATLAVQYIVTSARATHYLSQVQQHPHTNNLPMKLRAQFIKLNREATRIRSQLRTLQEQRRRQEAANAAARKAAARRHADGRADGGVASPGTGASPAQPSPPPEGTQQPPPRRSPPALRVIQGGRAS
jgi:hypothetical protein